ncbi:MAG: aminotransferase class V-fold PLP-dependent enzyme [Pirellulales bacterium]
MGDVAGAHSKPTSIYFDHASTTPLRPQVAHVMRSVAREGFANPSSQHAEGRRARRILEDAREKILSLLGCSSSGSSQHRLVFTSGATESNWSALFGLAHCENGTLATSARDHNSLRSAALSLAEEYHWNVETIPLNSHGLIDQNAFNFWLDKSRAYPRAIVSNTLVCGQTGTIQSRFEIGKNVLLHADMTQGVPYVCTEMDYSDCATVTLAPHKFGGPRGIGALLLRGDLDFRPRYSGTQEHGMRGGTEAVALAAGFAHALEMTVQERHDMTLHLNAMRNTFESAVIDIAQSRNIDVVIVGSHEKRSPHISTIAFSHCDRQALVLAADLAGLACSSGTACSSGASEPAPALLAMNLPKNLIQGAVRFSFGHTTTVSDVHRAIKILREVIV